ncbi:hypothetical protein CPB84DRAFT_1803012 [Gymnopilus junonius]|uniref:Uncharacterized protein n=1 Tax=Gymnopilus junonius TaxID=109634 RepID=A0A9P5N880_GYMJU|nr:hypothetical protein CPB84DRAFT_1803012 [Gymnopilus junonius]
MAVKLVILSLICSAILAPLVPVQRIHMSVPSLSLVLWLVACNSIHGVNAAI